VQEGRYSFVALSPVRGQTKKRQNAAIRAAIEFDHDGLAAGR
jgi:hypothetical protein